MSTSSTAQLSLIEKVGYSLADDMALRKVQRGSDVKGNRPLFEAIPNSATFYRRIHILPNQSCYTSVTGFPILADSYAAMMTLMSRRPSSPGVRVCLFCSKH